MFNMKYIITFNEQSKNLCFNELKSLNANFCELTSLTAEQSLVQIDLLPNSLAEQIYSKPCIFVRHIFCVDDEYKKDEINVLKNNLLLKLNAKKSFSVQFQTNINHSQCQTNVQQLADFLQQNGNSLNVKNPEQIVSIYETQNCIYCGLGTPWLNLSSFKAGMPHFSKKSAFVSRAEYKLLEAINLCNINLGALKFGADLGSAPGGWTKVLSSFGITTHSIDPASLSPEVKALPNVKHFRMTTEIYLQKFNYSNFDIVINDMKMDIFLSSQIILDFHSRITNGGFVIMTFKLAKNFKYNQIIQCIQKLQEKYKLILARQLFHNRSEITVVLQK